MNRTRILLILLTAVVGTAACVDSPVWSTDADSAGPQFSGDGFFGSGNRTSDSTSTGSTTGEATMDSDTTTVGRSGGGFFGSGN
jgi:hypothetical protein